MAPVPVQQIAATLGVPKSTCLNIYKHAYKNATEKKEVAPVLPGEIAMLRESTTPSEITTPRDSSALSEVAAGVRDLEELEERLLQLALEDPTGSNSTTASSVLPTTPVPSIAELISSTNLDPQAHSGKPDALSLAEYTIW